MSRQKEMPQAPESSEASAEGMHEKIQSALNEIYLRFKETGDVSYPNLIDQELNGLFFAERFAHFVETNVVDADGRYTKAYRENAEYFLDALISQIAELRKKNEPQKSISSYAMLWRDYAFSCSENLFTPLHFDKKFVFASRMYALPEARGSLGIDLEGEMIYQLQFSNGEYEWLEKLLKTYPFERQLDILHFLEHVGKASTMEGYADDVLPRLCNALIKKLNVENQNPIERYATEATLAHLNKTFAEEGGELEEDDILISDELIQERRSKESAWWTSRVQLSREPRPHAPIIQISSDYIAAVDPHRGTPETLARIPQDAELLPASSMNHEVVGRMRECVDSGKKSRVLRIEALRILRQEILPMAEFDGQNPATALSQIFPEITESAWEEILEQEKERDRFIERCQKTFQEKSIETNTINQDLFERMNTFIQQQREEILLVSKQYPKIQQWFSEYENAETDDQRFNAIKNLPFYSQASVLFEGVNAETQESIPPIVDRILAYWKDIQEQQRQNLYNLEDVRRALEEEIASLPNPDQHTKKILKEPDFDKRIRDFADSVEQKSPTRRIESHLFEEFEGNTTILPRGSKKPIDSALLLKEIHRPEIRLLIETDLGLDLRSLTLREQIHLLSFMAKSDPEKYHHLSELIRDHGEPMAISFLSCESDPDMSDAILNIGENAPEKQCEVLFGKYAELARLAEQTAEEMGRIIATHKKIAFNAQTVSDALLERARRLLSDASKKIKTNEASPDEIAGEFSRIKGDLLLFASVFRAAFKENSVARFEDMQGMELRTCTSSEIDDETAREILFIARENWKHDPKAKEIPVKALEEKLRQKNDESTFYILKRHGELLASMRFDELPSGDLYAGSLNVNPAIRGSAIGEAFLSASLDQASQERTVRADFFPQVDAGMMYIDRIGWVIDGVESIQLEDGSKIERCAMARNLETSQNLLARNSNITKEYLIGLAGESHGQIHVEQFLFPKDQQRFLDVIKQETSRGMIASRYFADPKDPNTRYVAFEAKPKIREKSEERLAA